jgi:hypothetical protein
VSVLSSDDIDPESLKHMVLADVWELKAISPSCFPIELLYARSRLLRANAYQDIFCRILRKFEEQDIIRDLNIIYPNEEDLVVGKMAKGRFYCTENFESSYHRSLNEKINRDRELLLQGVADKYSYESSLICKESDDGKSYKLIEKFDGHDDIVRKFSKNHKRGAAIHYSVNHPNKLWTIDDLSREFPELKFDGADRLDQILRELPHRIYALYFNEHGECKTATMQCNSPICIVKLQSNPNVK